MDRSRFGQKEGARRIPTGEIGSYSDSAPGSGENSLVRVRWLRGAILLRLHAGGAPEMADERTDERPVCSLNEPLMPRHSSYALLYQLRGLAYSTTIATPVESLPTPDDERRTTALVSNERRRCISSAPQRCEGGVEEMSAVNPARR